MRLFWLAWIVPLVLCIVEPLQSMQQARVETLMPGLYITPPFDFALPEDFVVAPLAKGGRLGLAEAVVWGTPKDIEAFYTHRDQADRYYEKGIMLVRLSDSIVQTGLDTFSDDEQSLKQAGVRNLKVQRVKWGQHPVFAAEGYLGKSRFSNAWVGMNLFGEVVMISYFPPQRTGKPADARQLWADFLNKTTILPPQEAMRVMGYEMSAGQTLYTRLNAKAKVTAQRTENGKPVALLEPAPNTWMTVTQANYAHVPNEPDSCFLQLQVNVGTDDVQHLMGMPIDVITVQVKDVEAITLRGDPLFENEAVVVLQPKA